MKVKIRQVTFEDKDIPLKVEILYENDKGDWVAGRYYYADDFNLSTKLIKDILNQGGAETEVLPSRFVQIAPSVENLQIAALTQENEFLVKKLNQIDLTTEDFIAITSQIVENRKKIDELKNNSQE